MPDKVQIAFVDDHPMLLEGMSTIFSYHQRYEIVGTGVSADDALAIAAKNPHVMFMDLSMPGNVYGAIKEIAHKHSDTKIIVFTAFSSVDAALKALDAGAIGFALKGGRIEEVIEAVEVVLRGEMYITKEYAGQIIGGLRDQSRHEQLAKAIRLSARERQVVAHLMEARTNREMAEMMRVSEQTIKYYMKTLMTKLNARNRLEVVIEAKNSGALD